jgi:hypothetical protein
MKRNTLRCNLFDLKLNQYLKAKEEISYEI